LGLHPLSVNLKKTPMKAFVTIIGAILGGVLGFFATGWLARQGLYSVILPGALMGLGTLPGKGYQGAFIPFLLGPLGVVAVYLAEWHYFPFIKDDSLSYFAQHLSSLKPITHVLALLGGFIAFWVPFRNQARNSD
jgi:hypothetical protein